MTSDRFPAPVEFLESPGSQSTPTAETLRSRSKWVPWFGVLGLIALGACNGGSSGTSETDTEGIMTLSDSEPSATVSLDESSTQGTPGADVPTCGESEFVLQVAPTRVMLVLDKSGSMVINTWDHDNDPMSDEITRWASLHATVDLLTTNFNGSIEFGAQLYPSLEATSTYDENACLVAESPEVSLAPDNAMTIMDALPPADAVDEIQGGTPSATAITGALQHLQELGSAVPGSILFITDGEANCRADAGVVTELFEEYDTSLDTVVDDAWMLEGIPTYVVGIAIRDEVLPVEVDGAPDGVNPHEQLNMLAELGGRPQMGGSTLYYATENQMELEAALAEIVGEQFDCVVGLDPPPEFPAFVEIEINGEPVEPIDDCATEDGWLYINPDGPYDSIALCGTACDLLAAQGVLDAIYRCPPPG